MGLSRLHEVGNIAAVLTVALLVLLPLMLVRALRRASTHPAHAVFVPAAIACALSLFLRYGPALVEDVINHPHLPVLPIYHQYAAQFPATFRYADLHSDALLWGCRDLLETKYHPFKKTRVIGHVDLPRLIQGNVKIQVFAAVNSVPRGINLESNEAPSLFRDSMFLKTMLERWPVRTWTSPKERVLYQFTRLHNMAARSNGSLHVVRSSHDLTIPADVLAIQAVEGLSCLEDRLETVDHFFNAGVRVMGATHFFDTSVGGSQSGTCNCGISDFGRQVVERMRQLGMIIDLAHASIPLMSDILELGEGERPPLFLSHTGIGSVCKSLRNLDDEYVARISKAGGLIGIALFEPAQCGNDIIASFVKSVSYVSTLLGGVESIALGSDWDGAILTSVSAAHTHLLSSALLATGNFSESDVRKIMFENAYKFFAENLPA